MIDFGILINYRTSGEYARSIVNARVRLARWNGHGFVLKDRSAQAMSRIAVAIFDENGRSEIDLLLMGDTLYVLGARLAESQTWIVCKNQDREFQACGTSIAGFTEFQSGYGALGITPQSGTSAFLLTDCSLHVNAIKDYLQGDANARTKHQIDQARLAFAYFAMTIGESIRFRSICARLSLWGISPCGSLPELQRWVVDSTVRDEGFPSRIAVYGVHEKTSSNLYKQAMDNLRDFPALSPGLAEFKAAAGETRHATVEALMEWIQRSGKVGTAALVALRSAYFKNRLNGTQFVKGLEFVSDASKKKNVGVNHFAGIDQSLL